MSRIGVGGGGGGVLLSPVARNNKLTVHRGMCVLISKICLTTHTLAFPWSKIQPTKILIGEHVNKVLLSPTIKLISSTGLQLSTVVLITGCGRIEASL